MSLQGETPSTASTEFLGFHSAEQNLVAPSIISKSLSSISNSMAPHTRRTVCSAADCTPGGTHNISCVHCGSHFHHRCLGWPDEPREMDGLEFRCAPCRRRQASCNHPNCPGIGIHRITCEECRNQFHYQCLGWRDEPRDTIGLTYRCEMCRERDHTQSQRANHTQLSELFSIPATALEAILPEFAGKPHEDPGHFLQLSTEVLEGAQLPARAWHNAASKHLKGDAAIWWNQNKEYISSWTEFQRGLTRTFNHPETLAQLKIQLYGTTQRQEEPAESYIRGKQQLYQRIAPETTEAERVQAILASLKPELRFYLSRPKPTSLEDLLEGARTFELNTTKQKHSKVAFLPHRSSVLRAVWPAHRHFSVPTLSYVVNASFHIYFFFRNTYI